MIILWLMLSIFLGVNTSKVNINKLNIIWYPLIIVTGYGLYECCSNIPKYKKAVCILLVSVYLVMFGMFNYKYYTEHINQIETSFCWSNGLNTTMKYALDSDKENIKIDEEVLKNGACPIYVKFINEFYKNKNYENTAYVVKKENMKDELKQYIKFEVLDYIVLYK